MQVTKNPNFSKDDAKKFWRKCHAIRLSDAEMEMCQTIMQHYGIYDFSKTVRFLIKMEFDTLKELSDGSAE